MGFWEEQEHEGLRGTFYPASPTVKMLALAGPGVTGKAGSCAWQRVFR